MLTLRYLSALYFIYVSYFIRLNYHVSVFYVLSSKTMCWHLSNWYKIQSFKWYLAHWMYTLILYLKPCIIGLYCRITWKDLFKSLYTLDPIDVLNGESTGKNVDKNMLSWSFPLWSIMNRSWTNPQHSVYGSVLDI